VLARVWREGLRGPDDDSGADGGNVDADSRFVPSIELSRRAFFEAGGAGDPFVLLLAAGGASDESAYEVVVDTDVVEPLACGCAKICCGGVVLRYVGS